MLQHIPAPAATSLRDALHSDTGEPTLFLVTGACGSGKTTLCRALADEALRLGKHVCGVLSPPVFDSGRKVGISLLNLATGESRLLARRREAVDTPAVTTTEWAFDPVVLAWGDDVLRETGACDLLVVDELGPLELERGEGWQSALPLIGRGAYRAALVVVRPRLLDAALARWPRAAVLDAAALREEGPR